MQRIRNASCRTILLELCSLFEKEARHGKSLPRLGFTEIPIIWPSPMLSYATFCCSHEMTDATPSGSMLALCITKKTQADVTHNVRQWAAVSIYEDHETRKPSLAQGGGSNGYCLPDSSSYGFSRALMTASTSDMSPLLACNMSLNMYQRYIDSWCEV